MFRIILLAGLGYTLAVAQLASAELSSRPSFEAYPANAIYRGPKAPIKLVRGTKAWRFRTVIREGYESKPVNYAGRFVVVEWGCGAPCQQWAIVDARTGRVHVLPFQTSGGAEYRPDSSLFVADPPQCTGEPCEGPAALKALYRGDFAVYYRWTGRELEKVYSAAKSPKEVPSNKPLQPTRAAEPNGQREPAGSGPHG